MPFPTWLAVWRWGILIALIIASAAAPLSWYLYWRGYTPATENQLNQYPMYSNDPGLAHSVTWQHPEQYWNIVLLVVLLLLVFYRLFVWRYLLPNKERRD